MLIITHQVFFMVTCLVVQSEAAVREVKARLVYPEPRRGGKGVHIDTVRGRREDYCGRRHFAKRGGDGVIVQPGGVEAIELFTNTNGQLDVFLFKNLEDHVETLYSGMVQPSPTVEVTIPEDFENGGYTIATRFNAIGVYTWSCADVTIVRHNVMDAQEGVAHPPGWHGFTLTEKRQISSGVKIITGGATKSYGGVGWVGPGKITVYSEGGFTMGGRGGSVLAETYNEYKLSEQGVVSTHEAGPMVFSYNVTEEVGVGFLNFHSYTAGVRSIVTGFYAGDTTTPCVEQDFNADGVITREVGLSYPNGVYKMKMVPEGVYCFKVDVGNETVAVDGKLHAWVTTGKSGVHVGGMGMYANNAVNYSYVERNGTKYLELGFFAARGEEVVEAYKIHAIGSQVSPVVFIEGEDSVVHTEITATHPWRKKVVVAVPASKLNSNPVGGVESCTDYQILISAHTQSHVGYYTPLYLPSACYEASSSTSAGTILPIVFGVLLAVVVIGGVVVYYWRARRGGEKKPVSTEELSPGSEDSCCAGGGEEMDTY